MAASSFGWCAALLAALLALGGCSSNDPSLIPVSGRVTLAGSPLVNGTVSYRPEPGDSKAAGHQPTGALDSEGRYRLFTAGKPGAPPGKYKVVVFAYAEAAGGGSSHAGLPKSLISDVYHHESKTPLAREVRPDAPPTEFDLVLEDKP